MYEFKMLKINQNDSDFKIGKRPPNDNWVAPVPAKLFSESLPARHPCLHCRRRVQRVKDVPVPSKVKCARDVDLNSSRLALDKHRQGALIFEIPTVGNECAVKRALWCVKRIRYNKSAPQSSLQAAVLVIHEADAQLEPRGSGQ